MSKSTPIDPNNPKGTADPKQGDDQIRKTNAGVIEILEVDHYVGANTTDVGYQEDAAGEHAKATLRVTTSPVSVAANKGVVFSKDADSVAELHYIDENLDEAQITRGGKVNLDKNIVANNTPLQADNEAGDGFVDLIKAGRNEADDTDVMLLSDAARMDTDAEPAEDTGVANKKYVDKLATMVPAASGPSAGYAGEKSVTLPNGLIMKFGKKTISSSGNYTITFADDAVAAFPTACLHAQVSLFDAAPSGGNFGPVVKSYNTTTLVLYISNSAAIDALEWFAIGY
jgi:hypothetical protein